MQNNIIALMLFLILLSLNIMDYITTVSIIQKGGRELNKVVKFFIDKLGLKLGLIIVKSSTVILIGILSFVGTIEAIVLLCLMTIVYAIVVFHNYREMKR